MAEENRKAQVAYIVPEKSKKQRWLANQPNTSYLSDEEFKRAYVTHLGLPVFLENHVGSEDGNIYLFSGGVINYHVNGTEHIKVAHESKEGLAEIVEAVKKAGKIPGSH